MSADNDDQAQDDILELCSMVEEYKECFQIAENENRELREQLQEALVEIERMRGVEIQQAGVIERLDDSVNQLVEEIEQNTQIMFTKDADLASLQHVLGVIHKRKVEVDDQTQLQQSRQIESLTAEKNKLGEAYSLNLKILEDYLTIINQKDSEILDLNHTIKQLELQIENFNNGSEESERKEELERLGASFAATQSPPTKSTNSTTSGTGQPSPPVTQPNTVHSGNSGSDSKNNSSRPATAPAQKTLFTDNPARTAGNTDRLAAARRAATPSTTTSNPAYQAVDSEYSSDDNNEEEPSPVLPVTISRNRSTRMMRNNSTSGAGGGSGVGSVGGSINSGNVGGTGGVSGSLHSVSVNNMRTVDTSSNKEAALSKYRRYVALNTTTTPTPTNSGMYNANTTNIINPSSYASYNSVSNDDVDAESSYVDNSNTAMDTTHSTHNNSTSAGTGKWSDVGKHERLFDKVDIIKQPTSNNTTSTNSNTNTTATRRKSQPTTKPTDYNIDNYTHPTLHTTPANNYTNTNPSHITHTTHITNTTHSNYTNSYDESDGVEVFVNTDSNPPSPERTKPNKLFKPPFSKPVFNEFTHNKVGKGKNSGSGGAGSGGSGGAGSGGSGGESGNTSMWSKRTTSYTPDPDTSTSTSTTSGSAVKKSIRTSDNGESRI